MKTVARPGISESRRSVLEAVHAFDERLPCSDMDLFMVKSGRGAPYSL